jgi:hypothetical protein
VAFIHGINKLGLPPMHRSQRDICGMLQKIELSSRNLSIVDHYTRRCQFSWLAI